MKGEIKIAEKRMFAKTIIDSDDFLDMPSSAQALYFHLGMRADDDGFVNKPKAIMRDVRCTDDDIKLLIAKQYLIPFESGVVVIRHWRIHNYIQKDRYHESIREEKRLITADKKTKEYHLNDECMQVGHDMDTSCIQNGYSDKNRLDKSRLDKNILSSKLDHASPVVKEVVAYLNERTKKNYKATTSKTKALVKARLNDGFSLDDFKMVIDTKTSQWLNTEMEKYLRPETLFGTKFEGYLQEKAENKKEPPAKKIVYEDEIMEAEEWI